MSTPADKHSEGSAQDIGSKSVRQPPQDTHKHLELDIGEERIRYRVKWCGYHPFPPWPGLLPKAAKRVGFRDFISFCTLYP
jgi:hypothetical protein